MPLNCFVPQCFVNSQKCKGVSFFSFPNNSTLRKKWIIAIKNAKEPNRCSRVCSRHFTEVDFFSKRDDADMVIYRKLRKDAIPHCHLPVRKFEKPLVHRKNGTSKVKELKSHTSIRIKPCFNLEKRDEPKSEITHTQLFWAMSSAQQRLESYANIAHIENSQAKRTSYSPALATALQQSTFNIIPSPTAEKKSVNIILKNLESRSILKCNQKSQTKQIQRDLSDTITSKESIYFTNPISTNTKISVNSILQTSDSCYISQSSKHSVTKQPSNLSVDVNALQQSTSSVYLLLTIPQTSVSSVLSLQTSKSCSTPESRQKLIARETTGLSVDSTLHQESTSSSNHLPTLLARLPISALQTPKLCSILKSNKNSVSKLMKKQFSACVVATAHREPTSSSNPLYEKDKVCTPNRTSVDDAILEITNEMNLDCSLATIKKELQKERLRLHKRETIDADVMSKKCVPVPKYSSDNTA